MLTCEELKEAELGREFDIRQLQVCCRAIYGGVAWPGKRPGFVVVLAMARDRQTGEWEIYILDEFESSSYREILRHCEALNSKYEPEMWVGDTTDDSADLGVPIST